MKHVVAVFEDRRKGEEAVESLTRQGFTDKELSLLTKGSEGDRKGPSHDLGDLTSGASWGAGVGGAAGILASAGLIAIPGVGPILAAGPLAAALTGAATGTVAGALMDYGIPKGAGERYEKDIRAGRAVVVADCRDDDRVRKARQTIEDAGGRDIEVH